MITRTAQSLKSDKPKAGEVQKRRVRILQEVKNWEIIEGGKHIHRDLVPDEVVEGPVWAMNPLVNSGSAELLT